MLGGADFGLHLTGPTGCYKSEVAALVQQHFGAGLDARNLPASWASTANATEELLFLAQDALVTVDDWCPAGGPGDVQRLNRDADRLVRGQGNRAGRQRMRADGSLRPPRPPRGLLLSTGEDTPRGQSLRARLLVLEVCAGDFGPSGNNPALSARQREAAAGLYALSLAGLVRWLAPRLDAVRGRMPRELAALRDAAAARPGAHARTPGIVASLALGLRYFLDYAADAGAIDSIERARLWEEGWRALGEAGADQAAHAAEAEPAARFLRLLSGAIAAGHAHLAGPDGTAPADPRRWGWRGDGGAFDAAGTRAGWLDAGGVFLEPAAAFAVVQRLAGEQEEPFGVSEHALRRRLNERRMLASTDDRRGKLTVRRSFQGERRDVLHVVWPGNDRAPAGDGPEAWADTPAGDDGPAHDSENADTGWHPPAAATAGTGRTGRLGRSGTGGEGESGEETNGHEQWGE